MLGYFHGLIHGLTKVVFFLPVSATIMITLGASFLGGDFVFGQTRSKPVSNKVLISQFELSGYSREILKPEFWLEKIQDPQMVIWNQEEIKRYNDENLRRGRVLSPFKIGTSIHMNTVREYIHQDLNFLYRYIKYDIDGVRRRDPEFSNLMKKILDYKGLENKKSLMIRYGLIVDKDAELRYFPTELKIFRNQEDREFEILKKTHLDPFSPVAILWESTDRKWYFVETILSRGWIKKEYLVTGSLSEIRNFFMGEPFGVVINPVAPVYQRKGRYKELYSSLSIPMGIRVYFHTYDPKEIYTEIIVPGKSSSGKLIKSRLYIKTSDISPKFLPFTYENLAKQSFKFLGSLYSWGGRFDRTDCSLFLYRVFGSLGLVLPRSSTQQIKSIKNNAVADKGYSHYSPTLSPFRSIAYIPGPTHILLYLGKHRGRDYYIHSTWSFYDLEKNEYLIKSVVVSDLSLGEGSHVGSLEKRISHLGLF